MDPTLPAHDARLTFGTALSPSLRGPAPGQLNGPLLLHTSPRPLPQISPKYHESPSCLLLASSLLKSDYSKWISWSQTSIINTFPSNLTYIYPYYQRSSQSDAGDVNLTIYHRNESNMYHYMHYRE